MRYILQKTFKEESNARIRYLFKIVNLWFIISEEDDRFTVFTSIPSSAHPDILFIVGHNYSVRDYLINHHFTESTIVAVTCDGSCNLKKHLHLKNATLYIPHQNEYNEVDLLCGRKFGIDFDLTESELLLYNSPRSASINEKISSAFQALNKYRRNASAGL